MLSSNTIKLRSSLVSPELKISRFELFFDKSLDMLKKKKKKKKDQNQLKLEFPPYIIKKQRRKVNRLYLQDLIGDVKEMNKIKSWGE